MSKEELLTKLFKANSQKPSQGRNAAQSPASSKQASIKKASMYRGKQSILKNAHEPIFRCH